MLSFANRLEFFLYVLLSGGGGDDDDEYFYITQIDAKFQAHPNVKYLFALSHTLTHTLSLSRSTFSFDESLICSILLNS